jgi:hypothetical protein
MAVRVQSVVRPGGIRPQVAPGVAELPGSEDALASVGAGNVALMAGEAVALPLSGERGAGRGLTDHAAACPEYERILPAAGNLRTIEPRSGWGTLAAR